MRVADSHKVPAQGCSRARVAQLLEHTPPGRNSQAGKCVCSTMRQVSGTDPEVRIGVVDYAPNARMAAHDHATLGISIVLRGTVEETVGRTTEQAGTAGFVVKPPGTVHSNRFGPAGARLLSVEIRPALAEELVATAAFHRWRWLHTTAVLRIAARTLHAGSGPTPAAAERADTLIADIVDLLAGESGRTAGGRPPAWLLAIRDRLHVEYAGPCRARDLARDAGVHPVYLARVFRRHFGCSLTEYLRRQRVRAAAAALGEPVPLVAGVAAAAGFADQSHLCRTFRAAVGVAPAGYRALVRGG